MIVRNIVYGGTTNKYVLNEGDIVKCKRCGNEIVIGQNTVKKMKDGREEIVCNNVIEPESGKKCGFRCDAVHYMGYRNRVKGEGCVMWFSGLAKKQLSN